MGNMKPANHAKKQKRTLATAEGKIDYTLMNDMLFHMVMSKSKKALKGLVCALKGFRESDVRSVKLLNTIDYTETLTKQIALDVRVELNNRELIDIEIQVAGHRTCHKAKAQLFMSGTDAANTSRALKQHGWINRSLLYLCRTFDNLQAAEDYERIKPATHVGILDFNLFPEHPEFYARYLMTNVKNGNVYTPNFALNVLSLKHIDKATAEDEANSLVYWARLFKATTWEELKKLAEHSAAFEEVTDKMYKVNTDEQERYLIEAHEKYMLDMLTEKNARKRMERELRKIKRKNKAQLEAKDQEIEAQAQDIEAQAQKIEELRKQLAAAKR